MFTEEYFESDAWQDYLRLKAQRPEAFADSPELSFCTDPAAILSLMNRTGQRLGVLYRSAYSVLVVDPVAAPDGSVFAYERILPAAEGAVVAVPKLHDRYVLLRQYRHALRAEALSFPRGFGEPGLGVLKNAAKELLEEIGARVSDLKLLGAVAPDSGLLGARVSVVLCQCDRIEQKTGHEGIRQALLMTEDELRERIASGEITDGYTLAAWALLHCGSEGSPAET